jgi:hypothetical protein
MIGNCCLGVCDVKYVATRKAATALIDEFRRNEPDRPAFWMIERYWDPTADADD